MAYFIHFNLFNTKVNRKQSWRSEKKINEKKVNKTIDRTNILSLFYIPINSASSFHFLDSVPWCTRVFNFDRLPTLGPDEAGLFYQLILGCSVMGMSRISEFLTSHTTLQIHQAIGTQRGRVGDQGKFCSFGLGAFFNIIKLRF